MNQICSVCGDEANGHNYNEFTCSSCKVFFHRNSANFQKLKCRKLGNCEIDIETRKSCSACRLRKCLQLGMKRKTKRIVGSMNSEFLQIFETMINKEINKEDDVNSENIKPKISKCLKQSNELNELEWKLISDIKKAASVFGNESCAKITYKSTTILDCFLVPEIYFQWIVTFCSKIETFNSLNQKEQLKVLKSFCFDVLSMRIGFQTDAQRDGFPRFLNYETNEAMFIDLNVYRKKQNYDFMDFFVDYWFALQREMENDFIIRDLLTAQLLFKYQEKLANPEYIKYHFTLQSRLLYRYLENKYKNSTSAELKLYRLLKLMDLLDQVRECELILCNNEVQFEHIPHIVVEMFDLA